MTVHIYVGPTLRREEVSRELPEARIFGPVSLGDVYRSVEARAGCIAIIDGYFERVPPVWHKEILHALSAGVHVFGASSMGALRAAELDTFGMIGVGKIYDAFRSGALTDDDEVTVVHRSEEESFLPISEAMVNLRATALAAVEAGVVRSATAEALIGAAKQRFYAERSFAAAIADAQAKGAPGAELAAFRDWLPAGRVDQKAADARSLLLSVRHWLDAAPKPFRARFRLERTDAWQAACRAVEAEGTTVAVTTREPERFLEEELKLAGLYHSALDRATARAFAIADARRAGFEPDRPAIVQASERVRADLGLIEKSQFEAWIQDQALERQDVLQLFEDQARVSWARPKLELLAREQLVAGLRVAGEYRPLSDRAREKAKVLEGLGPRGPSLSDLRMSEAELWEAFFRSVLKRDLPADLERFARRLGFEDSNALRAAAIREIYFRRVTQPQFADRTPPADP